MIVSKGLIAGGGASGALVLSAGVVYLSSSKSYLVVLVLDSSYSEYKAGQLGFKYGWYLAGTYGSESENSMSNEIWWKESYENLKGDWSKSIDLSEEFKDTNKVKLAYSKQGVTGGDSEKALNRVCETIYKQNNDYIKVTESNKDEKNKLNRDIWRYCSSLGSRPKTISETKEKTYETKTDSYGVIKKSTLVSVTDSNNDVFWKLRNDDFFGKNRSNGLGVNLNNGKNTLFMEIWDGKRTVKGACSEAYYLNKTDSSDKFEEDKLSRFCGWNFVS